MKGVVFLVAVPVVIFLGLFVAAMELTRSRALMRAYGPHVAMPLSNVLVQGAAISGLAILLIAAIVVFERRRVARQARRRRRRSHRVASDPARVTSAVREAIDSHARPPLHPSAPLNASAPLESPPQPATLLPEALTPPPAPVVITPAVVAGSAPPVLVAPAIVAMSAPVAPPDVAVTAVAESTPVEAAPIVPEPMPPLALDVPEPARSFADPLDHWGLREPAFDNAPSTRFFYLSPEHEEALFRLRYAIQYRKGGAVLTGDYGCGKTTLARTLVRELDPDRYDVALIANPLLSPTEFLYELLYQLGVQPGGTDKATLLRALETRLVENLQRGRDTVVIVDEAQLIDDDALFDELRLLLNFQTNDRFLITLVLAGSDELIATLRRHPHLAQRCVVRASLVPLDREQTEQYVRHRLVTAGREAETLTPDAVDELFTATGGTPRVINAVCDLTLFVGAAAGLEHVDGALVRRVAEDVADVAA